jgi:hypothetical protein
VRPDRAWSPPPSSPLGKQCVPLSVQPRFPVGATPLGSPSRPAPDLPLRLHKGFTLDFVVSGGCREVSLCVLELVAEADAPCSEMRLHPAT